MKHLVMAFVVVLTLSCKTKGILQTPEKVLVFTKTSGFRHQSIEIGVKTIETLGKQNHFEVTHTENARLFASKNLNQYELVVF